MVTLVSTKNGSSFDNFSYPNTWTRGQAEEYDGVIAQRRQEAVGVSADPQRRRE